MGLEEVDGEVFNKIVKGTAKGTPKDSKKRRGVLESDAGVVGAATDKFSKKKNAVSEAEPRSKKKDLASGKKVKGVAVAEKKQPANKKAKVEEAAGKVEVDGKAGAAAQKGKRKEKKVGPMGKVVMAASEEGVAGTSDNNNAVMLTLKSKGPKVKAPKMTSSEIKRRKKEKRRERKSEQEAARREKLEPSAISGFFRGPEAKSEEIEQAEEKSEEGDEDQGDEVAAADSKAEANGHAVEESAGQVPDVKKLSQKERAKLRAKEENERRAALGAGGVREQAGKVGTKELKTEKTGGMREQNGASLLATASASAQPLEGSKVEFEGKTKAGGASKKRKAPETGASEGAKESEGPVLEEDDDEEVERRAGGEAAGPAECDVSAWEEFGLHPLLLKGLAKLGFSQPTEIQKQCIPAALQQGKVRPSEALRRCAFVVCCMLQLGCRWPFEFRMIAADWKGTLMLICI
jgi:hypothetical protein